MAHVKIIVGATTVSAKLLDTALARDILNILPFKAHAIRWGDELYFEIPIVAQMETPTLDISIGDLAYWPIGKCFCIFYGMTPASSGDNPMPASEVEVFGRIDEGADILRKEKGDIVVIERV